MMERLWSEIVDRFGNDVTLYKDGVGVSLRALIQPVLTQGKEQEVHSVLGLGRQERFRYMGPPEHPLDLDTVVAWKGREYRVQSAHLVGEGVCPHWRAMLCPGEEGAL